jgi:hypothetical protein
VYNHHGRNKTEPEGGMEAMEEQLDAIRSQMDDLEELETRDEVNLDGKPAVPGNRDVAPHLLRRYTYRPPEGPTRMAAGVNVGWHTMGYPAGFPFPTDDEWDQGNVLRMTDRALTPQDYQEAAGAESGEDDGAEFAEEEDGVVLDQNSRLSGVFGITGRPPRMPEMPAAAAAAIQRLAAAAAAFPQGEDLRFAAASSIRPVVDLTGEDSDATEALDFSDAEGAAATATAPPPPAAPPALPPPPPLIEQIRLETMLWKDVQDAHDALVNVMRDTDRQREASFKEGERTSFETVNGRPYRDHMDQLQKHRAFRIAAAQRRVDEAKERYRVVRESFERPEPGPQGPGGGAESHPRAGQKRTRGH